MTLSVSDAPRKTLRRVEVGGLDDQRVALPPADRVAPPRPHAGRQPLAILADADDARVVHHLGHDHHVIARLHDRVVVVVEVVGQHRRAGVRPERGEAALGQRPVLGVVVLAELLDALHALGLAGPALVGQRRHPAVGRIDDERGAVLAVDRPPRARRRRSRSCCSRRRCRPRRSSRRRPAAGPGGWGRSAPPAARCGPARPSRSCATTSGVSAAGWPGGRSSGVIVALVQLPCRSGCAVGRARHRPCAGLASALPRPAPGRPPASASSPAARADAADGAERRCERAHRRSSGRPTHGQRRLAQVAVHQLFDELDALELAESRVGVDVAVERHAIVHGRVKVSASSIVASYWMWSGPVIV